MKRCLEDDVYCCEIKRTKHRIRACMHPDCFTHPVYNVVGKKRGLYCREHALNGMINVVSTRCMHLNCTTQPSYNVAGEKRRLYCREHALDGMVDVASKRCIHPDCFTHPVYNVAGEKRGLYCREHALDGMIDVVSTRCMHHNCFTRPVYNVAGKKRGLYCREHALDGMIDVVNKRCMHDDCFTHPVYNVAGKKRGLYCREHALDGMIDVVSKRCHTPHCNVVVNNSRYRGYCLRCFMYSFPNEDVARNYKTKERAVHDYLVQAFPDWSWRWDKRVLDGCSLYRPDFVVDFGEKVLMVEVDEDQHREYDSSCEKARRMHLWRDTGCRNVVVVRFNPDEYHDVSGKRVTSCWGINKAGVCVVRPSKRVEWAERLQALSDQLVYWSNHAIEEMPFRTVCLFYDQVKRAK